MAGRPVAGHHKTAGQMWRWTAAVCLWGLVCLGAGDDNDRVLYKGAQLLRVAATSSQHRDQIKQLADQQEAERWREDPEGVDLFVPSKRLDAVKHSLSQSRLRFQVIIDDVQEVINSESPQLPQGHRLRENTNWAHNMSWDHYHKFDDMSGYLDYLARSYPNLVTLAIVGYSVERRPLKVIKISSGDPNAKAIWIDGGTHAREWISQAAVTYLARELVENRDQHLDTVKGIDFYILPVLNPDGYEFSRTKSRMWRKNRSGSGRCKGTDLNRNWGYKWNLSGTSSYACDETYDGPRPFSEPETTAVAAYIMANRANIKGFLTFHSYGQWILHPWGYAVEVPPDYKDLKRVGQQMTDELLMTGGRQYTAGNSAALLYPAAGAADDWAKAEAGIKYSYTIELPSKQSFILPPDQIVPASNDALVIVRVLADAVRNTP